MSNPILIVAIGMLIVIGGILALRLHAFLALILGALAVAALTSKPALLEFQVRQKALEIVEIQDEGRTAILKAPASFRTGSPLDYLPTTEITAEIGRWRITERDAAQGNIRAVADEAGILATPEGWFLSPADRGAAESVASQTLGERVASGFGQTATKIGILIAMAAIIGGCLLESGAAERIVRSFLKTLGEEKSSLALLGSSFTVGIPVFFDTVFYLLMPIARALHTKLQRNYLLYVLCIVAGATMAHSLVPPTPGPLFVANELQVNIGTMMIAGLLLGMFTVSCGYTYARWANSRWTIHPPSEALAETAGSGHKGLQEKPSENLPPLSLAMVPILLPVLLIAGHTFIDMMLNNWITDPGPALQSLGYWASIFGNKNLALVIAAIIALVILHRWRPQDPERLKKAIPDALASGGVIILITAAGGAFGLMLRQTGISQTIQGLAPAAQLGLLPLAFFVTSAVRIAQGSATVAMITSVGIVAPIAAAGDLSFHPVYLALAIGCGSKPIPWMNDSGFWIITRMSGMKESETLKTATVMMTLMGVCGLVAVTLAAWILPLA